MNDRNFLTSRIDGVCGPAQCTDRALVPWWSFTKAALATGALQLVACNALKLDDPIKSRPYTLRQLLPHRAGVPDYGSLPSYHEAVRRGETPWGLTQLLDRVSADRLQFEPGHGWCYSNVGYLFVRQMLEEVTGQEIGSALQDLVFDALGLDSVRLVRTVEDLAETAWGNPRLYDPQWVYHGLLAGTPNDAVRFLHQLMSGHVLSPALLNAMTNPHVVGGPWPGRPWQMGGFGLGLMIVETSSAETAIGHSGAGPGSVAAVYHFRDRPSPCTVAAFGPGEDKPQDVGIAEREAVRLAVTSPDSSQTVEPSEQSPGR